MRFAKPLDESTLDSVAARFSHIVTVGGQRGSGRIRQCGERVHHQTSSPWGIVHMSRHPDRFVDHGTPAQLMADLGLDVRGIGILRAQRVARDTTPQHRVRHHGQSTHWDRWAWLDCPGGTPSDPQEISGCGGRRRFARSGQGSRAARGREIRHRQQYLDVNDMLVKEDIEAVVVCTSTDAHRDVCRGCIKGGEGCSHRETNRQHYAEAAEIATVAREAKRKVMVGMNHRFRPDTMILKSMIEGKELGKILYARVGWLPARETRSTVGKAGGTTGSGS